MQELRELILGAERLELDHLKERLSDPETRAQEVAAIVASAIEQAAPTTKTGSPKLSSSRSRVLSDARRRAIRRVWPTPCFQSWARPSARPS